MTESGVPALWEIWSVKMEPHLHPAVLIHVVVGKSGERRLLMIPITSDAEFDSPSRRVTIEYKDDEFQETGLSWTGHLFPTGVVVRTLENLVSPRGYLPQVYVDQLLELMAQPDIAAKMWRRVSGDLPA